MKRTPYWQKLQDPEWQKKRLEVFKRDDFTCSRCGETKRTLAVHHRYYVSGRQPWEYPMAAFRTLCVDCHEDEKINTSGPHAWEHFLSSCHDSDAASRESFEMEFFFFCRRIGVKESEALHSLTKAFEAGVITPEDLARWKTASAQPEVL